MALKNLGIAEHNFFNRQHKQQASFELKGCREEDLDYH